MFVTWKNDVTPNLIGDDNTIVCCIHLHGLLDFFALPDASKWIMGRTKDSDMNVMFTQTSSHIFIIHTPHSLLIADEWGKFNTIPSILNTAGKANIRWTMY